MKTYHFIQRITAMILLAVLCMQPVEFAFAQSGEEPVNQLIDEQADEAFSWITDLDRVNLSALSNAFAGTNIDKHGQKYGGSVCAIIEVQTGALTAQNGYYYLPGLNIKAPSDAAVSCEASFVGEEEGTAKYTCESDAVAVSNGIATINVPFTKDITKSGLGEVFIQLRWKDASGNTVMLEKMHGEFKTSLKLITDRNRFELINAFYKPGSAEELVPSGVLESSGFSS